MSPPSIPKESRWEGACGGAFCVSAPVREAAIRGKVSEIFSCTEEPTDRVERLNERASGSDIGAFPNHAEAHSIHPVRSAAIAA